MSPIDMGDIFLEQSSTCEEDRDPFQAFKAWETSFCSLEPVECLCQGRYYSLLILQAFKAANAVIDDNLELHKLVKRQ